MARLFVMHGNMVVLVGLGFGEMETKNEIRL